MRAITIGCVELRDRRRELGGPYPAPGFTVDRGEDRVREEPGGEPGGLERVVHDDVGFNMREDGCNDRVSRMLSSYNNGR